MRSEMSSAHRVHLSEWQPLDASLTPGRMCVETKKESFSIFLNSCLGLYVCSCAFFAHTTHSFPFPLTGVSDGVFKLQTSLWARKDALSPPRLPSRTYTHSTVKCLWVCFVIIKWQTTLWAAATLKWNVFFKAGGNRPCKRQSRLRKFRQGRETHTHTHAHTHTAQWSFSSYFCSRSV